MIGINIQIEEYSPYVLEDCETDITFMLSMAINDLKIEDATLVKMEVECVDDELRETVINQLCKLHFPNCVIFSTSKAKGFVDITDYVGSDENNPYYLYLFNGNGLRINGYIMRKYRKGEEING